RFTLALESELVASGDIDFQVVALQSGQFGLNIHGIAFFPDIHRGKSPRPPVTAVAPAVEQAVHLGLQLLKLVTYRVERTPTRKHHEKSLLLRCILVVRTPSERMKDEG